MLGRKTKLTQHGVTNEMSPRYTKQMEREEAKVEIADQLLQDLKGSTRYCYTLGSCPFAESEASEIAQGYSCLPTVFDIVEMRVNHGRTWACHSDVTKPCKGAIRHMREKGIDCTVIDSNLVHEDEDWSKLVTYK